MANERIPSLFPEVQELPTPPGRGEHAYYRRLKDGWIVTAPAWPSFEQDMRFKGFERLHQYGTFTCDMGEKKNRDVRGQPLDVIREPWRLILQQKGATEFSVAQIIAFRWHIQPPYQEVKFPQLQGLIITTLYCPECEQGVFAHLEENEAADQLRIHLMSGINDRHKYTPKDMLDLGTEWGINLMPRRIGRRPVRLEKTTLEKTTRASKQETEKETETELAALQGEVLQKGVAKNNG
mgnify:CR=1 FL=1